MKEPGGIIGARSPHAAKRGRPDNLSRFNTEQSAEIATLITPLEFARIDDPDWFTRAQALVVRLRMKGSTDKLGLTPAMIEHIVANINHLKALPIGHQFVEEPASKRQYPDLTISGIRRDRAIEISKALLTVTKQDPDLVRHAVLGYLYATDERMHVLLTNRRYASYGCAFITMVDQIVERLDSKWLTWRLIGFEVDGERKDPTVWQADLGLDESRFSVEFIKPVNPHNRAELDHLRIDVCLTNGKHHLSREFYEVMQLAAVTELWSCVRPKRAWSVTEEAPKERHDVPSVSAVAKLPDDVEELKSQVRSLLLERDQARRRAEEQESRAAELEMRAEKLHQVCQHLQAELNHLRKGYYGPASDRRSDTPPSTELT